MRTLDRAVSMATCRVPTAARGEIADDVGGPLPELRERANDELSHAPRVRRALGRPSLLTVIETGCSWRIFLQHANLYPTRRVCSCSWNRATLRIIRSQRPLQCERVCLEVRDEQGLEVNIAVQS